MGNSCGCAQPSKELKPGDRNLMQAPITKNRNMHSNSDLPMSATTDSLVDNVSLTEFNLVYY